MKRKSIFRARTLMLLSHIYSVFVLSETNPVIIYIKIEGQIWLYVCLVLLAFIFMTFGAGKTSRSYL